MRKWWRKHLMDYLPPDEMLVTARWAGNPTREESLPLSRVILLLAGRRWTLALMRLDDGDPNCGSR